MIPKHIEENINKFIIDLEKWKGFLILKEKNQQISKLK